MPGREIFRARSVTSPKNRVLGKTLIYSSSAAHCSAGAPSVALKTTTTDGHPAGHIKNNKTGEAMDWKYMGYALDREQKARL